MQVVWKGKLFLRARFNNIPEPENVSVIHNKKKNAE